MTSAAQNTFPVHIQKALDVYIVPALPKGFSDRLVEKALKQAHASSDTNGSQRWRKSGRSSAWRRGGYIGSGIIGFGLVSAAAAAALSLAEIPVKIPIMSDLVERVLPVSTAKAEPVRTLPVTKNALVKAGEASLTISETVEAPRKLWREMQPQEKRALIQDRVVRNETRIQERRAKRGLPPLTKNQLRNRRLAIRRALANPETRKPIGRRAMRRAAVKQAIQSGNVKPVLGNDRGSLVPAERVTVLTKPNDSASDLGPKANVENQNGSTTLVEKPVTDQADAVPENQSLETMTKTAPISRLPTERRQILQDKLPAAAKKRLQQASPAERQRIIRDMRSRRKDLRNRKQSRQRLRDIRGRRK